MSDVVPSFFPTPLEIAGGIRWMREHPVVATAAAAAATAVSVLTYLKAHAEEGVPLASAGANRDNEYRDDDDCAPREDSLLAARLRHSSGGGGELLASPVKQHSRGTDSTYGDDVFSSTESEVSTPSPTVRRSHPSSTSVSAFAFGGQDDEDATTTLGSLGGDGVTQHSDCNGFTTQSERGSLITSACFESVAEEDEDNSTSPQWGWYVSTTPPDEYYT